MEYANIANHSTPDLVAAFEQMECYESEQSAVGDLFEGFILGIDQAVNSSTDVQSVVVLGSPFSRWEPGDSSKQVEQTIVRNAGHLNITFVSDDVSKFKQFHSHAAHTSPRDWCLAEILKPGIKLVKPVTTCRLPLEFADGALKLPGYVYLSCKENSLPSMKRRQETDEAPAVMNRVLLTNDDEGIEEEIAPESVVRAYVYGDKYVPVTAIDKSLIELPEEEKSLKVLDVIGEDSYDQLFIIGQTSLFVPDPTCGLEAFKALYTLAERMRQRKVGIIARLKARANHSPKLVLILPCVEKSGFASWCFTMNTLPFRNDVRNIKLLNKPVNASQQRLAIMKEFVQRNSREKMSLEWNMAWKRLIAVLACKSADSSINLDFSVIEEDRFAPSLPVDFDKVFAIAEKATRKEERQELWKKSAEVTLADIFQETLQLDRDEPLEWLAKMEAEGDPTKLVRVVMLFGDMANESLITEKGVNFLTYLTALRELVLSVIKRYDLESVQTADITEAYNQILDESISIIKLDRRLFANIESEVTPGTYILETVVRAGRSIEQAEQVIKSLKDAPAKQVDIPTQDTSEPTTQPDLNDEEFDELE